MKNYLSPPNTSHFSIEIESLRGIAALSVLMGHFYLFMDLPQYWQKSSGIVSTLRDGFFNPQPAVLLFFTISGLVLGRQLHKEPVNDFPTFMAYLCRRIFRLIPLMWAAILFAFILEYLKGTNTDFSVLYANLSLHDISLDTPMWSLKVELCCSFFFPFLFLIFAKGSKVLNALLFIILCGFSYFWQQPIFIQFFVFFHAGLLIDFINTHYKKNCRFVNSLSLLFFILVFMLAPEFTEEPRIKFYGCWQSWVLPEILACPFILFFIIHNDSLLNHFLRLPFVRYLGKISFSIYLFHLPLLLFVTEKIKVSNSLQFIGFIGVYLVSVILVSAAAYRWIELPTNRLGKILSSRLVARERSTDDLDETSSYVQ